MNNDSLEVTSNLLQKITLINPSNVKDVMQQVKAKLKTSSLNDGDLQKLCKALFYGQIIVFNNLKQQCGIKLADDIAQLVRIFYSQNQVNEFLKYLKALMQVLTKQWGKIDYWRTNKFLMMFRCILEEIFKYLKHFQWKSNLIEEVIQIFIDQLFSSDNTLNLHFIQIFVDSLILQDTKQITHNTLELLFSLFIRVNFHQISILSYCQPQILKLLKQKFRNTFFKNLSRKFKMKINFHTSSLSNMPIIFSRKLLMINIIIRSLKVVNRKALHQVHQILTENDDEDEQQDMMINDQEQENEDVEKKVQKKKKLNNGQIQEQNNGNKDKIVEKKQNKKQKQKQVIEVETNKQQLEQVEQVEQAEQVEQEDDDQEEDENQIEGLDYSEIKKSKKKMQILNQIMDSIPPYLFMSVGEKRKYFSQVSQRFNENIVKEKGTQCSHNKKVKFNMNKNTIRSNEFNN